MTAPQAEKRPRERELHGQRTTDDYAWLRDDARSAPDVLAHLEAENAHAEELLEPVAELREALFEEIRSRVKETDRSVPARDGTWWYYSRTLEGSQYGLHCRVAAADDEVPPDPDDEDIRDREIVLLDENVEAGTDDYFALGVYDLSPDHGTLAWAADGNGSEKYRLRFRDLATGQDRRLGDDPSGAFEEIPDVNYSAGWSADGAWFFYTRADDAFRPHEVWRHRLGTAAEHDVLVHHEPDERYFCSIGETKDRAYLVLSMGSKITTEIRVCPTHTPDAGFTTVVPRREAIEADLEHLDGSFYILTNDDALDFRVVTVPAAGALGGSAGPEHWVDVLPHEPGVCRTALDVVRGRLLVEERTEATVRVRIHSIETGSSEFVPQPEEVSEVYLGSNPDPDWPYLRHTVTSLVTPRTTCDLDLRSGKVLVRRRQEVLGGYDPEDYRGTRLWVDARDGERVPISVVARADRRPGGPVLLTGYGAYGISEHVGFSSARLSLLDRGWAVAIAHVRGGEEMGRRWYLDGKLDAKTNSFDDLVDCGRALEADGIAGRGQIAIRGGSAGGLLVGAALNRAPELWGAVVAEVPFVDCVNTIIDPTLPLTVTEWEEWGNPIDSPETATLMMSYAPYENIPATALPPVLATAGLHDPRVGYWEPAKWIARMRDVATGGPFLLRTELGAGHGGPSGRYDAWREEALVFAFLIQYLGTDRPG